ncbi:STAS domain-containing protein [Rossellomorea vietnamensis]|uniref:STAS domain-containing protein n=1 Tax=Rossellomorea vietnamensis TaxID=218284 RepID=A0A5D4MEF7_9BACI|nr:MULTISPECIES: STAS domain-containing protein [Bacillaceae]TYR99868.1 STAS domain-containing protein [Rossellomorea vietnamensis]
MKTKTEALYKFLIDNISSFTEDWLKFQNVKTGSHYSPDAPPEVMEKIKVQNGKYVKLVADSLFQEEEEMKKSISDWTFQTASDRANSDTSLTEVTRNGGCFRSILIDYVEKFATQTELDVNIKDVFHWVKKINTTFDYVMETFTDNFLSILLDRLSSQSMLINELSAPVITLTEDIGLLPIIGDIDTTRAKSILETTLQQSVDSGISYLIIDLSGVVMVDTMVAHQIFQLIESLNLIGVETALTGIRPEVAMTAVQLGIDFSDVKTESSLQRVILNLAKQLDKHLNI